MHLLLGVETFERDPNDQSTANIECHCYSGTWRQTTMFHNTLVCFTSCQKSWTTRISVATTHCMTHVLHASLSIFNVSLAFSLRFICSQPSAPEAGIAMTDDVLPSSASSQVAAAHQPSPDSVSDTPPAAPSPPSTDAAANPAVATHPMTDDAVAAPISADGRGVAGESDVASQAQVAAAAQQQQQQPPPPAGVPPPPAAAATSTPQPPPPAATASPAQQQVLWEWCLLKWCLKYAVWASFFFFTCSDFLYQGKISFLRDVSQRRRRRTRAYLKCSPNCSNTSSLSSL